jgi:hypothetical protein
MLLARVDMKEMDLGTNTRPGIHRIGFGIAHLIAMVMVIGAAHAGSVADSVFTVANYPVEARAKDSVTAKNTALADGQQAALRSLLRRLVPVTSYRRLKAMQPVKASDLIDGVSVRQERNSTTDYIATLDFAFQPAAIRAVLTRNGIPFVDSQAPQTILIPFYRSKSDGSYEINTGHWQDAWKGLDLSHTVSPLRLDKPKTDVTPETLAALVKGVPGAETVLASETKAERVVAAVAEPDAAGKFLVVTLAGVDAVGPFRLQRKYRLSGGDKVYTAELAAIVGLGVLEGRWKAGKGGAVGGLDVGANGGSGQDNISLVVEFATLAEWNDIRSRLLDTDGAFDVTIGSVSALSAAVALRHAGGTPALTAALASKGLAMSDNAGTWIVRSTF